MERRSSSHYIRALFLRYALFRHTGDNKARISLEQGHPMQYDIISGFQQAAQLCGTLQPKGFGHHTEEFEPLIGTRGEMPTECLHLGMRSGRSVPLTGRFPR